MNNSMNPSIPGTAYEIVWDSPPGPNEMTGAGTLALNYYRRNGKPFESDKRGHRVRLRGSENVGTS